MEKPDLSHRMHFGRSCYNFNMSIEYDEWLKIGVSNGWVSQPFCHTHDGDPYMTIDEEKQWEEGDDPCLVVLKVII